MARFKKIPQVKREGRLVYGKDIVYGIVNIAIEKLEFIELALPNKDKNIKDAIKINLTRNSVEIFVNIYIHFSQNVSETAFKVQEAIRHNIETMTEYKVVSVNVMVSGILFDVNNSANNLENMPIIIEEVKKEPKKSTSSNKKNSNKPKSQNTKKETIKKEKK